MKSGLTLMIGGSKKPEKTEGMDVENEERRSALRAFMSASQNGDVEQGMKAWARMGACGAPPVSSDEEPEEESDNAPEGKKPGKGSMYREED
jgi:hypothetical protein